MTPQDLTDRYFEAMRRQDLALLLSVMEEDAVLVWPDGRQVSGKAEIAAVYAKLFEHPSNNPAPGPLMVGPDSVSTEVASRFDSGETRRTCNVFRFGASGLVARMDSYRQD